ncbi:hypothetical protein [Fusibacter sp. 3D3]|nr:hypothetical protein [Fusibacter sp. 3D3]
MSSRPASHKNIQLLRSIQMGTDSRQQDLRHYSMIQILFGC